MPCGEPFDDSRLSLLLTNSIFRAQCVFALLHFRNNWSPKSCRAVGTYLVQLLISLLVTRPIDTCVAWFDLLDEVSHKRVLRRVGRCADIESSSQGFKELSTQTRYDSAAVRKVTFPDALLQQTHSIQNTVAPINTKTQYLQENFVVFVSWRES